MDFLGTVVKFEDILKGKLNNLKRDSFLNAELVDQDKRTINLLEGIYFMPNSITEQTILRNSKYRYTLELAGIVPSGLKICLLVNSAPYFMVRVPDEYLGLDLLDDVDPANAYSKCETFKLALHALYKENNITSFDPSTWDLCRKFQSDGIQLIKGFYYKISFYTTGVRNRAINLISIESTSSYNKPKTVMGYHCHTAIDDPTKYYLVVSRDNKINLCGWNYISNYKIAKGSYYGTKHNTCHVVLECEETDICECSADNHPVPNQSHFRLDNSIQIGWDIEAGKGKQDGEIPDGELEHDRLFMIGMTVGWYHQNEPFYRIAITFFDIEPMPNILAIKCMTEKEVCLAYGFILGAISPEYIVGFNDGSFDYPFVAEKLYRYKLLEYFKKQTSIIYKETELMPNEKQKLTAKQIESDVINFKLVGNSHKKIGGTGGLLLQKEMIKLDPETQVPCFLLTYFGTVAIDVRCQFRIAKFNPDESSLKYVLEYYGLPSKEDMPIVELFEIYDKAIIDPLSQAYNMSRIATYCVRDAEACHEIIVKSNDIMDCRNKSAISYTSFADAVYRAGGMKVRNMVIAHALRRDIVYSNIQKKIKSDNKYPGGHVQPPVKGMQTSKLSMRERLNNPNLSRTYYNTAAYNFSILTEQFVALCESSYKEFYNIMYADASKLADLNALCKNFASIKDDCIEHATFYKYHPSFKNLNDIDRKMLIGRIFDHITNKAKDIFTGFDINVIHLFISFLFEENGRPITGLDFSSLYPSIFMTYNLSKEYMLLINKNDRNGAAKFHANAEKLRNKGYNLHHISFPYGESTHLEQIEAYSIRHTYDPNSGKKPEECNFGIFPSILFDLFYKRAEIKSKLKKLKAKLEHDDKRKGDLLQTAKTQEDIDAAAAITSSPEYIECKHEMRYLNSLQTAIKLFMNTFYGETGNQLSSLFMLELSGGVTMNGRVNICKVIDYLQSIGAFVLYGDTDSSYTRCAEITYKEEDILFYSNKITKLEYWTKQVENTMVEAKRLNNLNNEMLFADNGTRFLNTAYEEVLFPGAFLSKKKYYATPHEGLVNFFIDEMFVRGLDLRKRGTTKFSRKICEEVMKKALQWDECRTLRQIIEDSIVHIYTSQWEPDDFVQKGSYKPLKQNVAVHTFVRRMREERGIIIKPVEKFEYVQVKKNPYRYDLQGRVMHLTKGDVMELYDIAVKERLEIDLDCYMDGTVIGQLGRLITYDKEFEYSSKNDLDAMEADYYKNATSYIKSLCDKHATKIPNVGPIHKKAYRAINTHYNDNVSRVIPKYNYIRHSKSFDALITSIKDRVSNLNSIRYASNLYSIIYKEHKKETLNYILDRYLGPTGILEANLIQIDNSIEKLENSLRENIATIKLFNDRSDEYYETSVSKFRENDVENINEDAINLALTNIIEKAELPIDNNIDVLRSAIAITEELQTQYSMRDQYIETRHMFIDLIRDDTNKYALPSKMTMNGLLADINRFMDNQ